MKLIADVYRGLDRVDCLKIQDMFLGDDLNLCQITESPYPIRTQSTEEIEDLTKSIQQQGLLNAILVKIKNETMYEIIAGSRRYNAAPSTPY